MEKEGIENLWKLLELFLEGGNVVSRMIIASEEKWYKKYLGNIIALSDEVMGLISVNFLKVIPEYKDLSQEELDELKARAIEKFDIPNDEVEAVIERIFEIILKLRAPLKELLELIQSLREKSTKFIN
jgi:hypothetical protein